MNVEIAYYARFRPGRRCANERVTVGLAQRLWPCWRLWHPRRGFRRLALDDGGTYGRALSCW